MATTVETAQKWIQDGYVLVAPLEHGYAYLVDAFNHDGVRTVHAMRGDALGVSAQVLLASTRAASGIIREITPQTQALMDGCWPGLLSLNVRPQVGLMWDLGDDRKLDTISVRVPRAEFVLKLLAKTGPLACASAAKVGQPAILKLEDHENINNDILRICDFGELTAGPASTVVLSKGATISMTREGAIAFEQLQALVPEISRSSSAIS